MKTHSPVQRARSEVAHPHSDRPTSSRDKGDAHNRDAVSAGEAKGPVRGAPSESDTAHAAATTALQEKGVGLGTPDSVTPPLKRRIVREKQQGRPGSSVETRGDPCPPQGQQTSGPDRNSQRMYEDDGDSESVVSHDSPSRTFNVFETPRRDQLDLEFKRPSRPRAQLKRSPVAGRWQQRGAATPARSRRSELQLLMEGQCDAIQTPHGRGAELKPDRVSNRWQQLSTGRHGRPRPDLKPSPLIDRRHRHDSPMDTPRRDHSTTTPPAG